MDLQIFWFCLIGFFWAGYFVLEGFDFGVGMLLPFLPRNERERDMMFESIGPVWDGNEVWLVVAGAATFAAFPAWYATLFSGFYLALLLILFFLIVRVVSFEWREKSDSPRWRAVWTGANTLGSVGVPFLWGIAFANLLRGVPLDSNGDYAGELLGSVQRLHRARRGGGRRASSRSTARATSRLRTTGDLCERAGRTALRLALPAAVARSRLPDLDGQGRRRQQRQGRARAGDPGRRRRSSRSGLAIVFVFGVARGWAFTFTALGIVLVGRDDLHEPLPAGDGLLARTSRTA